MTKTAAAKKPKLHPPRRRVQDRRKQAAPAPAPIRQARQARPAQSPVSAQQAPAPEQAADTAPATAVRLPAPVWTSKSVRLGALAPWARNPRRINAAQAARLRDSFEHYGQVELLAIGPELELYNGHQRLKVLLEQHGPDFEVEVRQASRALTEKEREKLTIYLHRGAAGEFDFEMLLKDWSVPELDAWGFPDLNVPDVPEDEWVGMPEFDGTPGAYCVVRVLLDSEESLVRFAAAVQQDVAKTTRVIWYPTREKRDLINGEQWASNEP